MICNFRVVYENFMHVAASQKTICISSCVRLYIQVILLLVMTLERNNMAIVLFIFHTTCHTNCLYLVKSSTTGRQAQGRVFE